MTFLDLTAELLGLIDFEKSEIIQPQKLVFVCGGKASDVADSPGSLREILLQQAAANDQVGKLGRADVLLAEVAVRALAKSNFSNLLDLEEFIAAVVEAIVLIVESPGSQCELGSFVKTEEIRNKLIVILPSIYVNVPSFITNGAIDYLRDRCPTAQVLGFNWKTKDGIVSAPRYAIDDMMRDIPAAMLQLRRTHSKESFKPQNTGHKIYLTLAFCHILRAARLTDIRQCFKHAGLPVDDATIRKYIDTLLICKLLTSIESGKITFYISRTARVPLEIAFKRGTPNKDRNTLRWIVRIKSAIDREEPFRTEMFRDSRYG